MKIITSPAKLMDIRRRSEFTKPSEPLFIAEAVLLHNYLKEKTPRELVEMMNISQKLADENWERNQNWTAKPRKHQCAPAIAAFTGEVYRGLDYATLCRNATQYLQKNHRILSGLYGCLRPSDKIMPYRLEMGRKIDVEGYNTLYQYWSGKVTSYLNSEMRNGEFLLNLASAEYSKVINRNALAAAVIDVEFLELKNGMPRSIVVYTKHARGRLLRFCAETNAKTLQEVEAFNYDGYLLSENLSTQNKLVFTR